MKKLVALLTKQKWLRINVKLMVLNFSGFIQGIEKIMTIRSPHLLVNLFRRRYVSSIKSCKYLNNVVSKY